MMMVWYHLVILTLTLDALSEETKQHGTAMVAEGWGHVVVDFEPMRNIDVEPLCQHLKQPTEYSEPPTCLHLNHKTKKQKPTHTKT